MVTRSTSEQVAGAAGAVDPGKACIQVEGLRKTYLRPEPHAFSTRWYEDTEALAGVDLEIERGEFASIVGPSGCGKTTMLDILGGLEPATERQMRINDQEVHGPRNDTAIVFQQVDRKSVV